MVDNQLTEDLEQDVVDTEEYDESTVDENDDDAEFEYDEDGNIIVPDDDDSDDNETNEDAEAEDAESDDAKEDKNKNKNSSEEEKVTGKKISEKDFDRFKSRVKDMLTKLGVEGIDEESDFDALLKGVTSLAAEATDQSPEEYENEVTERERKADEEAAQREAEAVARFERVSAVDLKILKAQFPELAECKTIRDVPNWERFGRKRDEGYSVTDAYLAVKDDGAPKKAEPQKKESLAGSKAHLTSSVGKASKGGVSMPKSALVSWRQMFPGKSDVEIQKLYEKTL